MASNQPNPPGTPEPSKQLRLTLRTLLAYLDDVLEPSHTREIGARIQETPYASQLVDRIQEVLRRRRVAAPDLKGPGSGLDPNTVAEYLDNTLPAKAVPDVERVCLESDAHLAEVAACHQILTLVLGEPIHVSAESRERLHALIPEGLSRPPAPSELEKPEPAPGKSGPSSSRHPKPTTRTEREPQLAGVASGPSANGNGPQSATKSPSFSKSLPGYLQPTPLWKRALVPALVVGVLLLWVGLLIYDNSLTGDSEKEAEQVAKVEAKTGEKAALPVSPVPESKSPEPANKPSAPQEEVAVAPTEATNKTETGPKIDLNEEPPPDMPPADQLAGTGPPKPPETLPEPPPPEKPATAAEPMNAGETQPEPLTPQTPPMGGPKIVYTTKQANSVAKGMLLHYDPQRKVWGTLPHRAFVHLGEALACPEPLDAVFNVGNSLCEVTFIGGVLASFEAANPPAAFGLNISRGKFVFARPEGEDVKPLIIPLEVGEDLLLLELTEPNTRCGLEILPKFPNQFEQGLGANWYEGKLWVERGQIRLLDRNETEHKMTANQSFDLTPNEVAPDEEPPKPPQVQTVETLPVWLNPDGRTFKNLSAHYLRQLHAAFEEAPYETDISLVLRPLVRDDGTPPTVAVMAAKTLAMTGYLQDVADLLAMHESKPEEIREATIEGVRHWLTLHPTKEDGQRLREALGTNFNQQNEQTADDIYRLLWGYRKSDLKEEATAIQLVNWLDHKNIVVRTLAFMHLVDHTNGQTHKYRPLQSAVDRQESIERWREDVQNGGLFD